MKIGSHNSFTYLPVRKWWMKLLAFTARCQRVNIMKQYKSGARMFDLRVRYNRYGLPVICHGLIEYSHSRTYIERVLDKLNQMGGCYVRMVLELSKTDELQEIYFYQDCRRFSEEFKNIKFFGGNNRTDWLCNNPIYSFSTPFPEIDNQYASATTRFKSDSVILRYIDDLYPFDFAKRYNHKLIEQGTNFEWLMLDFVDIQ